MNSISLVRFEAIINHLRELHSQTGDCKYEEKVSQLASIYGTAIYHKSQLIELELIPIEVQAVIEHYSDFENHGLLSTPGAEM